MHMDIYLWYLYVLIMMLWLASYHNVEELADIILDPHS